MREIPLNKRNIPASQLVLGTMGLGGGWNHNPITEADVKEAHGAVEAALSVGINMFDLADIYTFGKSESVFGQVLKERPELRDQIILQSKVGIRFEDEEGPGRYDFSGSYIRKTVDEILGRLGLDQIDSLLLHRPDALMEPEEIADAIYDLKKSNKVKWFGVSNMHAGQVQLLQQYINEPLIVNQMEMSLVKHDFIETGVAVNRATAVDHIFPLGTLEHSRMNNIQIQAWGPLAQGLLTGKSTEGESEEIQATAKLVSEMAAEKNTTPEAIVLAWLMRHPAGIQPVLGTTNPERIKACGAAKDVQLTRGEWYKLFVTARGRKLT